MIAKTITSEELREATRVAFDEDKKIFDFFDRNVKVTTIEEIVDNVIKKISTYERALYRGVYFKGALIGYYVYEGNSLVSFGLNSGFRTRPLLRKFFSLIKKDMVKPFFCVLWSRNIRAVKWLIKMGLTINDSNPSQTQLIYK